MEATDFGFCGNSYTAPNVYQDMQRALNYYLEVSTEPGSKMPGSLLGCPGKAPIIQLDSHSQVRGAWVLPGGVQSVWVAGSTVYLVTMTVPAMQTSIAQFAVTTIGTLNTNVGPVSICDNGAGGYVVIVDGPYGYYYRIAGAGTFTFGGGVTNGSPTLTWPGSTPTGLIVGSTITDSSGYIPGATTIMAINLTAGSLTLSRAATNTNASDTFTVTLAAFGQITDPAFLGSDRVDFIGGWFLFNQPGTQNVYTNAPVPYTLMFAGLFFVKKDVGSDNVVTHKSNNRDWWLIGERQSEVWSPNDANANFGFGRLPGVAPQIGCAAKHSIARLGDELVWLARSERGENVVVKTSQYSFESISNHGVEHALSSYPLVSDAVGYTYEDEGHLFYVLTLPTADVTWVYDATTSVKLGEPCWHERASYNAATGAFHQDRGYCFVNFQNLRLVGDFQSGQIHRLSRTIYDDAGNVLLSLRRTPHVWSRTDRRRLFFGALQIEFAPGVGRATGQGDTPMAMLRQSNDSGQNYGNKLFAPIGKIGETKNRAMWRRRGYSRDTVWEVSVSDPVNRDIVGATLWVETEEEEEVA